MEGLSSVDLTPERASGCGKPSDAPCIYHTTIPSANSKLDEHFKPCHVQRTHLWDKSFGVWLRTRGYWTRSTPDSDVVDQTPQKPEDT